jgi:hypothetical protein
LVDSKKDRACVRYRADLLPARRLAVRMVTIIYRCPNTGFRVQGYPPEEELDDDDRYVRVTCLALVYVTVPIYCPRAA